MNRLCLTHAVDTGIIVEYETINYNLIIYHGVGSTIDGEWNVRGRISMWTRPKKSSKFVDGPHFNTASLKKIAATGSKYRVKIDVYQRKFTVKCNIDPNETSLVDKSRMDTMFKQW